MIAQLSDGTLVSLLSWMEGVPLNTEKCTEQMLITAGQTLAQLRNHMESAQHQYVFPRFSYDQKLVERLAERAEQGTEFLSTESIKSIAKALNAVSLIMDELDDKEEILLTHSDPGFGNMIWTNGRVGLIDWSLAGYAYLKGGKVFAEK